MKKIINGKKYDTDTATELATWNNGRSCSDFAYCGETIYRKKNGEFFLYGRGGAMSRYAQSCGGGSRCEGDGFIPLTDDEARQWVESHANDKYEDIFGGVSE